MSNKLWQEIKNELLEIDFELSNSKKDKSNYRRIQKNATQEFKSKLINSFDKNPFTYKKFFIHAKDLTPSKIKPRLVSIDNNSEHSDLFKAATMFWSVPITSGYGRRIKFLILDDYHETVIGILSIMDPVFNLNPRDKWIGWDLDQKYEKLKSVMDCNVLGAVPPYNSLLGGKLVVSLAFSKEIRNNFKNKYKDKISIISKKKHDGILSLLTVTSALGRSSIYNRVKLPWGQKAISVGYTKGNGVFQIPNDLFLKMRQALLLDEHRYADGFKFGQGPNWKMRVIRVVLGKLRLDKLINHGIEREIFLLPLGENVQSFLTIKNKKFRGFNNTSDHISEFWKERWALPRFSRIDNSFLHINAKNRYLERIKESIIYSNNTKIYTNI